MWSDQNPHWTVENRSLAKRGVMVWGGFIDDKIIGPHFCRGNVDGEEYLNMMGDVVIPHLHANGFNVNEVLYQHDGAPGHRAGIVCDWLDDTFDDWIGYNGTVDWPARSPDLNPWDFSLWPFVKNAVFKAAPATEDEIREQITIAFETLRQRPEMLLNVHREFIERLNSCIAYEGHQFQHFLE